MAVTINASTSAGLVQTADTSGVLALQTAGTTAVSISASQVVTLTNALAEVSGGTGTTVGYNGFKNRIINGAMVIDQRNAGASVTPTNTQYLLDRWQATLTQASKFTVEQTVSGVAAPAGFTDYLAVTSSSAYSVVSGDIFAVRQRIEGFNIADLAWGTASAAAVTVSFWVRSSLTGTFGAGLSNSGSTRNYPFTYSISSANTWEYKTVTILGDTSGTWLTTNGLGIQLSFGLGAGADFSGTANAWNGTTNALLPTGATSVVGTSGATFYITGVQLEKGSTATSFDYRPYGTEFQLCQRYYEQWNHITGGGNYIALGMSYAAADMRAVFQFQVPKRANVTAAFNSGTLQFSTSAISKAATSGSFDGASTNSVLFYAATTGLTTGQAMQIQVPGSGTLNLSFSAEL